MSKNKQRKNRIKYLLSNSDKNPQDTTAGLKDLQRGKRNTPTYQKIQNIIGSIALKQSQKRQSTYRKYDSQFGVDIPNQSRSNLDALKERVSRFYKREDLLNFRKTWYTKIVPEIVLKHVTRDMRSIQNRGALLSLNNREKEGDTSTNQHTRGRSARLDQVYFTLGLENHDTVHYWDNKPELITFHLGAAHSKKENPLPGLWISSHISPQVRQGHLPGKYFGETLRTVSYSDEEETKVTQYRNAQGNLTTIKCMRKEEFFSAENGLHEIFDGLFYQIVEEIHYISGSFQRALFSSPELILRQCLQHFFIPDVYPEAKVSSGMVSMHQPYVTTSSLEVKDASLVSSLVENIRDEKFTQITSLLLNHPELCNAKDGDKPIFFELLTKLLECKEKDEIIEWHKIVVLMLSSETDLNQNDFGETALSLLLSSQRKDIFQLLQMILEGIPDKKCPLIRHSVNLYQAQGTLDNFDVPLLLSLRYGNWPAFLLLQQYGIKPQSSSALILSAYKGRLQDKLLTLRDEYEADCNAQRYGVTALAEAIKNDDDKFIVFLKQHFPSLDLNLKNNGGDTPLHQCIRIISPKAFTVLLQLGADAKLTNASGRTPYDLVLIRLKEGPSKTVGDKYMGFQGTKHYDSLVKGAHAKAIGTLNLLAETLKNHQAAVVSTTLTTTESLKVAAAVLVKKINTDGSPEILFIRKKIKADQTGNRFLFPGGFQDLEDADLLVTGARECYEETGLKIKPVPLYECVMATKDSSQKFYVCKAEYSNLDREPIANDDAAEALWVNWRNVERRVTPSKVLFYYQGTQIETSNALLIEAELNNSLEQLKDKITAELLLNFDAKQILVETLSKQNLQNFKNLVLHDGVNIDAIPFAALSAQLGLEQWLELAIELGANLDLTLEARTSFNKYNALFITIAQSKFIRTKKLIEAGANFNSMVACKSNALIIACYVPESAESIEFIRYLIHTKRAKLTEDILPIALITALWQRNLVTAELLLECNLDQEINMNRSYSLGMFEVESTVLMAAVRANSIPFFRKILNLDIDFRDRLHFKLIDHIDGFIYDTCIALVTHKMSAPDSDRLDFFTEFTKNRAKAINIDETITKLQMRKLALQKMGSLHNKTKETRYSEEARKTILAVRQSEGRLQVLFMRDFSEKSTPWGLPTKYMLNISDDSNLEILYEFKLCNIISGRHCQYKILRFDEQKHSPALAYLSKDYVTAWINIEDIVTRNSYFYYQDRPMRFSDVLLLQNYVAGKILQTESELDKAIFCELYGEDLLKKAYLEKDQAQFRHLVSSGVSVNQPLEYDKAQYATGCNILLYFDLKYNEGKWCEFLLSLGSDVNYASHENPLPICQAIYEKDFVLARNLIALGAHVDLEFNNVSALSLLPNCDDEEFQQFALEYVDLGLGSLFKAPGLGS